MPIRFHCDVCDARVKVADGSQGRPVKCPRCGHMQRVPRHAEQRVAVGVGAAASDDSGAYEAEPVQVRTTTKNAPRKGGIDLGDRLSDLGRMFDSDDAPPPQVESQPAAAPRRATPLPGASKSSQTLHPARPRYTALRNLATALRVTPAVLIPAVLWHILNAESLSGAIVTLIGGAAIVTMTWTLAEIADAVRDMARRTL